MWYLYVDDTIVSQNCPRLSSNSGAAEYDLAPTLEQSLPMPRAVKEHYIDLFFITQGRMGVVQIAEGLEEGHSVTSSDQ